MYIEILDIILTLDLTKHYDFEDENAKTVYIDIMLELPHRYLFSEKLDQTFDYVPYERSIVETLLNKKFELLEEVAKEIFQFTANYHQDISSCKVELSKKNVLSNAKKIKMTFIKNLQLDKYEDEDLNLESEEKY